MKNLGFLGFSQYAVTCDGRVYSLRAERFLSLQDKGYLMVGLSSDNLKSKNLYVHRLVAAAFCDGYSPTLQVNHIDGCKHNNNKSNLEWVSRSENMQHAFRTGLINTKYMSEETAHKVCKFLQEGSRPVDVAEMVGVTPFNVQDILEHTTFTHVSKEYDFSKVKRKFRLSEGKVIQICELLQEGKSNSEVSRLTSTTVVNVRRIKNRVTFTHLTSQYVW